MQPITNLLINSARKTVKFLQRDFWELQALQRAYLNNSEFCNRSYIKLRDLLKDELKQYQDCLFFPEDKFSIDHKHELAFLINPLDSYSNFSRAIPFFALTITCLKRVLGDLVPTSMIIHFPALGEIYYAEKGKGAWSDGNAEYSGGRAQRIRIRVSRNADINNALIAADNSDVSFNYNKNNIRIFGSPCYSAVLLATGRSDIISLSSLDFSLYHALDLMIREAGGGIIVNDDKKLIASNGLLCKEISG